MEGRSDSDDSTATPGNVSECLSGDEATEEIYEPSPKKSRRGGEKKVVTVPIGEGDGSRSRTEVYPPPDSWSWRKYGQKPIKGSPFPRGYYRCSSSKGCPARKQVERSRLDPTTLLVTYAGQHNHPLPATTRLHHHHNHQSSSAAAAASARPTSPSSPSAPPKSPAEECAAIGNQPDLDPPDTGFIELAGDFGWLVDLAPTVMDDPTFVGPSWGNADVEVFMPIGEEDELLFGDLGDLPESSVVFRRYSFQNNACCAGTG